MKKRKKIKFYFLLTKFYFHEIDSRLFWCACPSFTKWNRIRSSKKKITKNKKHFKLTFIQRQQKIIILLRKVYAVAATTKKYQLTKIVCVSSSQAVGTSGSVLIVVCVPFVIRSKKIIWKRKSETIQCIHTNTDTGIVCTYDSHLHARRMCATVHIAASCPTQPYMATHTHKPWHAHNHSSH